MIKEAELLAPTGVMYVQENPYNASSARLIGSLNVHNPIFSHLGTGEDTDSFSRKHSEISSSLLPYYFLSMTTGCELSDIDIVVVVEKISEGMTTDYRIAFESKGWIRTDARPIEQRVWSLDTNSASAQAERLRNVSGLTVRRLADIFGVSRTTYHEWMSGSPLRDTHREHLLEVLSLIEEAARQLGNPGVLSAWLLTPVSLAGKKPVEYLSSRQYDAFRGFLLRQGADENFLRPPTPLGIAYRERPREEIEDELARLHPGILLDEDYPDTSENNE